MLSSHFSIHTNIKSILWNYPCTLNLLRQKCYCYHHHYSPHHDHRDNHLHHPNYCWGIVIVIVVHDIVIVFIDIAILGTYYLGIAGKMGKLNFGFGFFFCIQSKFTVKLVEFMVYLPAVKKNSVLSKSKSRCLCLKHRSKNILHINKAPPFKWHKMKMKNVEPILYMTDF